MFPAFCKDSSKTRLMQGNQRLFYAFLLREYQIWKENIMLYYALVFLVVAIIAGVLGFSGIAGTSAGIAQILFFLFLDFLVISLVVRAMRKV
jgi:uncharacterized membrane protein YtjA (UPF0391 family)